MKIILKLFTLCITTITLLSFIPLPTSPALTNNSEYNFEYIVPLHDNPDHNGSGT